MFDDNANRPSPRRAPSLLLGLTIAVTFTSLARGQECSDCHETTIPDDSVHVFLDCTDCHGTVDLDVHPDGVEVSTDLCSNCHDAADQLTASPHGEAGIGCLDCHGAVHEILELADSDSPMSPVGQVSTCGTCHDQDDLIDGYIVSIHGRALLRAGLVGRAPACSDCHGAHDLSAPSDPDSNVSRHHVPETCGGCHQSILEAWQSRSAHGIAWEAGNQEAPVCITCHSSHRIVPPREDGMRLETPETCGDCHRGRFSSFEDSFHGQATDLGFQTAAICSDCHTPHENLAASDPRSSVHADRLAQTCGTCHQRVNPSFVSFDPHSDPSDPDGNPVVHNVWLFMTALLIGVFGFFGIHDVLWLQRSVVALRRGELTTARSKTGPWVRRFTPTQIGLHIVVIVTFLVLAATGLPLKYHSAAWAQWPLYIFGSVQTARYFHRIAAILTFGYFVVHLLLVSKRAFLDHEKGLLWGWKSMVPRGKDFADLWGNLKYFLYLDKRPRFDRWSYWEKFDYFAVFWGVAIIGFSGLMLWFPLFVTRFLPGWSLNVAHVIHSDEALLAVGFIFVFHFFHSHLRPESFPLDPVIFTGSMPLERFKEEKPEEYRRLVESGELEGRLLEAPPERVQTKVLIWGYVAVAIGLALVFAILWGVLGH